MAQHGYAGLALATMMAGAMLICLSGLKLGRLLKFFSYPVGAGFTSGIKRLRRTRRGPPKRFHPGSRSMPLATFPPPRPRPLPAAKADFAPPLGSTSNSPLSPTSS